MLEMKDLLVQSADKVILDRVSLSLAEGESLSIVGESGSGSPPCSRCCWVSLLGV